MPGDFDNLQPMKGPILCRWSDGRIPFVPSAFFFVLLLVGLVPIFAMKSFAATADFRWVTDVVPKLGYSYSWTNSTPLAVDQTGNSYLVSPLLGAVTNGTNVLISRGGSDVLLMKYDRNGILNWAKRLGGDQNENGIAITLDGAGNSYLTGISRGSTNADFGPITVTNTDLNYLFVTKFDSNGNTIWLAKAGGNFAPLPRGIASDASGNCYVTGTLGQQTSNFGSIVLSNVKPNSAFIAKYDSAGQLVWVNCASSSSSSGDRIAVDDEESVYWLGEYSGSLSLDGIVLPGKTLFNWFWARLDGGGNLNLLTRIGGKNGALNTFDTAVALDAEGYAYFAGTVFFTFSDTNADFGGLTLTNHGIFEDANYDAFVAKCGKSGGGIWVKTLGGKRADYGAGVAVDGEGNCYVVGSFSSSDLDLGGAILASRGGYDAFIAKFDVLGNLVWAKQAGGVQHDVGLGIGADPAGNCYVVGGYSGIASFDSTRTPDVGFSTTIFLAEIVERPVLNLAFAAQQAFLYWPASKSDFSLESSTELSTNANWSPVTSPFVILGDQRVVIDDLKAGNRFYRLKE